MNINSIPGWMALPFVALLGAIALFPLLAPRWWEQHYSKVALGLGVLPVFFYLALLHQGPHLLETTHEYVSFICLIGSLFVVSGGIRITVKGESTPWVNTAMLAIGGIVANLLGTTGASMLLIRPYLRANKYRLTAYHVVFFIFIVSNVGGSLTPLGDPPLYLGFLKGVPFLWTVRSLYPAWLVGMAYLLIVFFVMDTFNFRRAPAEIRQKETSHETWRFEGLANFGWLLIIMVALFIHSPPFLREGLMIFAAVMSWKTTSAEVHQGNDFSWGPLREVAVIFAGIFATMTPALDWLEANAGHLGFQSAGSFYWGSGCLSSVLDNAPTYLNFMSAALGVFVDPASIQSVHQLLAHGGAIVSTGSQDPNGYEIVRTVAFLKQYYPALRDGSAVSSALIETCFLLANYSKHVVAISIGCVFFGANTYIGNGPNFMVKNIAEHGGAKMPTFFGYIFKYSIPILLPLLGLISWLFF